MSPRFTSAEGSADVFLSMYQTPFLATVALIVDVTFGDVAGPIWTALLCLLILLKGKSPVNAVAFGTLIAAGCANSLLVKLVVHRHSRGDDPVWISYPSGHAAFAIAFAIAINVLAGGTRWRRPAFIVTVIIVIVVGVSRIYIGAHYPTDVLASCIVAPAGVLFMTGVWNHYQVQILRLMSPLRIFGPVPDSRDFARDRTPEGSKQQEGDRW
ncbi:phosphatase PAP2 family protein [Paenarthrobacter sp. Z7-10]|uniref:phosphatase PAP2 family protein n=1 Tax=Paenarthrobacter sp. Z7-10 TaxID=2787635 RepID=UPI0022A99143|nr:phosphatase PAP2 family protein [Paenarthrobacter sp. Z7-10]MCZ2403974.1 phosphatase PAP2 family protein [Paenarthrobacter sp. Z7-10]